MAEIGICFQPGGEREARFVLHCDPADADALGGAIGIKLGSEMLRATQSGGWNALHLAPDEWVLVGPAEAAAEVIASAGGTDRAHSLVDVSHRGLVMELSGASAATLLNTACPLDLRDDAFPINATTRTLFGKAAIMLWRTGPTRYRVEYWRSFHDYVSRLIAQASQDLPAVSPIQERMHA